MPRSGTKLLREILNQHDDVSIPRAESGFIPYFYNQKYRYGDLNERKNFNKWYKEFKKSSFYYHMENADIIWDEEKLYGKTTNHSMLDLIESIYKLHAEYEEKSFWGDKTPEYIYYTKLIKHLFPEAKFIHIIRDVRDYCLSMQKAWKKNIYRAAHKWVDGIGAVKKDSLLFKKDYYEIRYEDLLNDPGGEVTKLCKWLDILYSPNMIQLNKCVENLGDTKNNSRIVKNNLGKWAFTFTEPQIYKIEAISGKMLKDLGYSVKNNVKVKRVTKLQNLCYAFFDTINLFKFRTKEYGSLFKAADRMLRDLQNKLTLLSKTNR